MPPLSATTRKKRDAPSAQDPARQKRAKLHAARSIPVQPPDAAFKDGELDLQAFVAAHEFEIRALEQSMVSSKAVGASRAFQKVPRGLRRRTASHNPKRVPRRLRARARREMVEDNTPMVEARRRRPTTSRARLRAETARKLALLAARKRKGRPNDVAVVGRTPRPKIRRNQLNEPPRPVSKFRRRQMNKTWLPTHAWHAKRARMTDPKSPLWRFAIPVTPNDKVYRLTHRSHGENGTVLWDMSYMSTIGLYGPAAGVETILRRIGVVQDSCWNDRGRRWRAGTRAWSGMLSREREGCRRLVCPATVVWNAAAPTEGDKPLQRQVYLRLHPSAFLELFQELLRLTRVVKPRVYIEDLRFEIGSVELSGPASTEALLAVLTPYATEDMAASNHETVLGSLDGLTNPAALPSGALLTLSIQDPRLMFPPRRREFSGGAEAQMKLLRTMADWPADENSRPSALFDRDARHRASCLPSQKSINRRRGLSSTTGKASSSLSPTASTDPPIPIMLIASRPLSSTHSQGSWTLLAPWKCILPLWHSLVRVPLGCGSKPRFGGLSEAMQVTHERGSPWFPGDYPATDAGARWELQQRRTRREEWLRRPKSRRLAWEALDLGAGRKGELGDGLACDLELLFGLQAKTDQSDPFDSLARLDGLSRLDFISLLKKDGVVTARAPPHSLLHVRLTLKTRGLGKSCARVYRLPPDTEVPSSLSTTTLPIDLRAQWLAPARARRQARTRGGDDDDLDTRKRMLARHLLGYDSSSSSSGARLHPLVPSAEDLIGFVTSGGYNLSAGRGVAFACLSAPAVLSGLRDGGDVEEGRLCVVRNAGENVGWLARWEAI
ncbi:hypothetical protein XA68_11988 [Ophiocordyceps unilateralis]|uniref:Pop1 N-terminal domain-containing protein n=1 Tax=Ophiocordyceps unilateralis TaxID=268505 RepID=A0A2A9PMP0_OPHUN|nr:hypothetical protein XA68_11988 [Ophiocordyceps unilateralis]